MADHKKQDQEAKRDLATVGGGNIPGESTTSHSQGNGNTFDVEQSVGRENADSSDQKGFSQNVNNIDRRAQDNLGGRSPAKPQTAMGDQDSTRTTRSDDSITDPMTSRVPNTVNQQAEHDH